MSVKDPNEYSFKYRVNFELRIMAVWFVAGLTLCALPFFEITGIPDETYINAGLVCFIVGLFLGRNGIGLYITKSKLRGYPLAFLNPYSNHALSLFGINDKEVAKNAKKLR